MTAGFIVCLLFFPETLMNEMFGEQKWRHSEPVRPHVEEPSRRTRAARRVGGRERFTDQRIHDAKNRLWRCPRPAALDHALGDWCTQMLTAVSESIKQRSQQVHFLSPLRQPVPEIGCVAEDTQQAVDIGELSQAALQVAI